MTDAARPAIAATDFLDFESLLTDAERAKLASTREFLAAEVTPICVDYWNRAEFPHQLISKLAEQDVISLVKNHGYSHLFAGLMHAEFTRADTSVGTFLGVHDALFTGTIETLASPEQQQRWLPEIYSLEKVGAFGLTEPEAGSDIAGGARTTARKVGDKWVLNGRKRWIGNATFSDWVVIFAKDEADGQLKAFMVDTSTLGYTATKIENKMSLRIVQNADIVLEDVEVPEENRLANANSFKDTNKVLKDTRLGVAWQAVGQQMAAFDVARDYALERKQFGKPLGSFQMIQDQLVQIMGNLSASTAMLTQLAGVQARGELTDAQSALAKQHTSAKMRESVALARSILGGNGIVTDYHAAKIFADAEAIYTYEGSNEVNTLIVGRALTGIGAIV
ncbi:acyl-CoA dehydrogenase family protein [Micrococcoides hystricis]|uniref:Acyl-CoA dehydrogenase family protein n=1 Tax=Micrococcoides hystricis TaxID=1572761 RepID=A0ABV6P8R3_9MICC